MVGCGQLVDLVHPNFDHQLSIFGLAQRLFFSHPIDPLHAEHT